MTNPVNGLDKPGVSGARRRARNVLLKRLKHRDMEYFVASPSSVVIMPQRKLLMVF